MAKRRIYKYKIDMTNISTLTLPRGSEIFSVVNHNDNICIYAIVDTETKETEKYSLLCYSTGHTINHDETYKFLGSIVIISTDSIYHVFYKKM